MGNPLRGEASFEALGREWTLRFNTNALCEFEEAAGVPVSSIGSGLGMKQLRALIWAGLGFHHRRNRGGLDNVGLMVDEVGAQEIAEVVMRAMTAAFPKVEGDASPPKAAQAEDGLTS